MVQVAGLEGVTIERDRSLLHVAHTHLITLWRSESDGLWTNLFRFKRGSVFCRPLATEVELVVGRSWEANQIRCTLAQHHIAIIWTRCLVVCLVGIPIAIQMAVVALVIVIPQEGIVDRFIHGCFPTVTCIRIGKPCFTLFVIALATNITVFAQPVFMANLGFCAVLAFLAATVEMRDFTLIVGSHQLSCERQADTLPAF